MNSCFRLLKPTGVKKASIMGGVKKRIVFDSGELFLILRSSPSYTMYYLVSEDLEVRFVCDGE